MPSVQNLFAAFRLSDTAVSRQLPFTRPPDDPAQMDGSEQSPISSPPVSFHDKPSTVSSTLKVNFSSHVRLEFQENPTDRTGDLVRLLDDIATVTHCLSAFVAQNNMTDDCPLNAMVATRQLYQSLCHDGYACLILERNHETPLTLPENAPHGGYVVMLTALDICDDEDAVPVCGTIFSVYKRLASPSVRGRVEDLQQCTRAQVASGYVIYSMVTNLIYTIGQGVYSFYLHPLTSQYFLHHDAAMHFSNATIDNATCESPSKCDKIDNPLEVYTDYSALLKADDDMSRRIRKLVETRRARVLSDNCFVADIDAAVRRGGLIWRNEVHLLCEAAPMAHIIRQMGGLAIDGTGTQILDLAVEDCNVHQVTAFLGGPRTLVADIADVPALVKEVDAGKSFFGPNV